MSESIKHLADAEAGASATPGFSRLKRWGLALLAALIAGLGLALLLLPVPSANAQTRGELRIGYQKSASLFVLQKAQGTLEKRLAPQGFSVKWVEFPAGPQLLEGLNVGAVDVGYVGEAPPIFAQAAGAQFVYFGFDPAAPRAEAILVTKDSPIKSVADLKGKKVALNKGSNVHYLLVKQLEKARPEDSATSNAGVPRPCRRARCLRKQERRRLGDLGSVPGRRRKSDRRPRAGRRHRWCGQQLPVLPWRAQLRDPEPQGDRGALFEDSVEQGIWLKKNLRQAAELIAPLQGLPVEVVELALQRYEFNVKPITPAVAADQQKIADTFFDLKLIPKAIKVSEAVVVSQP